jgi:hypothetical protein
MPLGAGLCLSPSRMRPGRKAITGFTAEVSIPWLLTADTYRKKLRGWHNPDVHLLTCEPFRPSGRFRRSIFLAFVRSAAQSTLPLRPRKFERVGTGLVSILLIAGASASARIRSHSFSRCYPRPHCPCQQARCKHHCSASRRRRIKCHDWDSSRHTLICTCMGMC